MAGDAQQKNKPELLCGVAPKIADGWVTARAEQPPPGALPSAKSSRTASAPGSHLVWEHATRRGEGSSPWGGQSRSQGAWDEHEGPAGGRPPSWRLGH